MARASVSYVSTIESSEIAHQRVVDDAGVVGQDVEPSVGPVDGRVGRLDGARVALIGDDADALGAVAFRQLGGQRAGAPQTGASIDDDRRSMDRECLSDGSSDASRRAGDVRHLAVKVQG